MLQNQIIHTMKINWLKDYTGLKKIILHIKYFVTFIVFVMVTLLSSCTKNLAKLVNLWKIQHLKWCMGNECYIHEQAKNERSAKMYIKKSVMWLWAYLRFKRLVLGRHLSSVYCQGVLECKSNCITKQQLHSVTLTTQIKAETLGCNNHLRQVSHFSKCIFRGNNTCNNLKVVVGKFQQ